MYFESVNCICAARKVITNQALQRVQAFNNIQCGTWEKNWSIFMCVVMYRKLFIKMFLIHTSDSFKVPHILVERNSSSWILYTSDSQGLLLHWALKSFWSRKKFKPTYWGMNVDIYNHSLSLPGTFIVLSFSNTRSLLPFQILPTIKNQNHHVCSRYSPPPSHPPKKKGEKLYNYNPNPVITNLICFVIEYLKLWSTVIVLMTKTLPLFPISLLYLYTHIHTYLDLRRKGKCQVWNTDK